MKKITLFAASWCGPCKMVKPIIEEIEKEEDEIIVEILDVDEHEELAVSKGIRSVPTIIIEKDNIEINRLLGFKPKSEILKQFE